MMIDPGAKLLAVLDKAEEYRGLAIRAKDRRERECYVRIVELYVEIAEELEALIDGWASPWRPAAVAARIISAGPAP
jgi:hypothetical protein